MERARRRPRTVVLLGGSSGGYGADRQLELLATGLDPSRYRPLVVLPDEGPLGARLEAAGVETVTTPLAVMRRDLVRGHGVGRTAALLWGNVRELGALARSRRASIVHSNSSLILCGQGVAGRASAAHLLHVREIYLEPWSPATPLWPLYRRRLTRADAVVCVSNAAAAQFAPSDRVHVVYDGVSRRLDAVPRARARRALDIDPAAFVVATPGRISDWKGQDVLIRALADPLLAGLPTVTLIAGDAAPHQRHFERELAELTSGLGLDGRVRLLSFREDVDVLLAAADVVVVPSSHPDSLPNACLEGAAASLPVVATDTGGQREIVRDGLTGTIVPPRDVPALARAIRALADDPRAAERMGQAGAEVVRDRFGASRMLDEIQERYDRVLLSRRVGPAAWLLPVKPLPVSHPTAPDLRISRLGSWLEELGYRPVMLRRRGLRSTPGLVVRALRERPVLVLSAAAIHAPALAAIKALRRKRTLVVADVIGLHSLEVDQAFRPDWARPTARAAWTALERVLVTTADIVLAVNDRHAELVRRRYRASGVFTLRDTAEPTAVAPPADASAGSAADTVAVGYAGSLVYSRLDTLFTAWGVLSPSEREQMRLVVVGDGPDLDRYRAREDETVRFLGALPHEQALAVLRGCDVGYSDCWTDAGFPAKVFEYMSLGLSVVTERTPQAAELLEDGRNALLYETADELAERLRELAGDPELRARLGESARRTFLERHTAEQRQEEFEALLEGGGEPQPGRSGVPRQPPVLVSVVMPLRNEAQHVADQLAALVAQTYEGAWELVVVDDSSTDGSAEIVERWRDKLPTLRIVRTTRPRGLNHARNTGAAAARGDLLAFCDADDLVTPGWLAALVSAAVEADLVGGALDLESLNPEEIRAWRPAARASDLLVAHEFLSYVPGGNCAIWADVASEIGWDEAFRFGSSDVEFAWRAQLAGYRLVYATDAVVRQRYRTALTSTMRQHFRYGASVPHLYARFRGEGMSSPGLRGGVATWSKLLRTMPDVLATKERRGHWLRLAAVSAGRLAGSVRRGAFFP